MDDVSRRVAAVMAAVLKCTETEAEASVFGETERWDSLVHVELVFSIEEEFDLQVPGEDMAAMKDFAEVCRIVTEQMDVDV